MMDQVEESLEVVVMDHFIPIVDETDNLTEVLDWGGA